MANFLTTEQIMALSREIAVDSFNEGIKTGAEMVRAFAKHFPDQATMLTLIADAIEDSADPAIVPHTTQPPQDHA
jgi:hypothetical protein